MVMMLTKTKFIIILMARTARGPGRKSNRVTTYSPGRARGAHPGNGEWTGAVAGAAPMVMRGVIVMAGV